MPRSEVSVSLRTRRPERAISVELEVPFHDTDPLFVAWHGWYYKYFEIARTALFRAHRLDVEDLMAMKLGLYVIETRCQHTSPLRYGDRMRVFAWVASDDPKVVVNYEVENLTVGKRAARGQTSLVVTRRRAHGPGEDEMLWETPADVLERLRSAPLARAVNEGERGSSGAPR